MRGLKRLRSAQVVAAGHALVQNIRRGHYELAVDAEPLDRLTAAFTELALAISSNIDVGSLRPVPLNATVPLAFDGVTMAEYLTFMETMAHADIHMFVQ